MPVASFASTVKVTVLAPPLTSTLALSTEMEIRTGASDSVPPLEAKLFFARGNDCAFKRIIF